MVRVGEQRPSNRAKKFVAEAKGDHPSGCLHVYRFLGPADFAAFPVVGPQLERSCKRALEHDIGVRTAIERTQMNELRGQAKIPRPFRHLNRFFAVRRGVMLLSVSSA